MEAVSTILVEANIITKEVIEIMNNKLASLKEKPGEVSITIFK